MADDVPPVQVASRQAPAVAGGGAIGEGDRDGEAGVDRFRVVARGIDMAFPGDQVVEAGGDAGIAGGAARPPPPVQVMRFTAARKPASWEPS
jgi:hypothetical protein